MGRTAILAAAVVIAGCGGHGQAGADALGEPVDPELDGTEQVPDAHPEPTEMTVEMHDVDPIIFDAEAESVCGNGVLEPGEDCDDGALNTDDEPDACRTDCTPGICRLDHCPGDPPDNEFLGASCFSEMDCGIEGGYCFEQATESFDGETYTNWPGGQCMSLGAIDEDGCRLDYFGSCPIGATCRYLGFVHGCTPPGSCPDARHVTGCLDACTMVDEDDAAWESNCDCRDGYTCLPNPDLHTINTIFSTYPSASIDVHLGSLAWLAGGTCTPGCSNDRECCEIWHDGEGGPHDHRRQSAEVTLLSSTACTDICNDCTFACDREGCPDGDCSIGDPCEHAADCPPNGACLDEYGDGVPAGVCTMPNCELAGMHCPAGSGCGGMGGPAMEVDACVVPCNPGQAPGDPGNACRDLGVGGASDPGDSACIPVEPGFWKDGSTGEGYCWPGNFPGGSTDIGGHCEGEVAQCNSPFGLGTCIDGATIVGIEPPGFCSAYCDMALALDGICGEADTGGVATGVCVTGDWLDGLRLRDIASAFSAVRTATGICLESCENPGAVPIAIATGCSQDAMACVPMSDFGAGGFASVGASMPAGLCFPSCRADESCERFWPATGSCDTILGLCE